MRWPLLTVWVALVVASGCSGRTESRSEAGEAAAGGNVGVEDVWRLVDGARDGLDLAARDDGEAVADEMMVLLTEWDPADIVAFDHALSELLSESYRTDLWAAAYVINGGSSDDGFDYCRGWFVSQGRTAYDRALSDPDSLADLPAVAAAYRSSPPSATTNARTDPHARATGHRRIGSSWW